MYANKSSINTIYSCDCRTGTYYKRPRLIDGTCVWF